MQERSTTSTTPTPTPQWGDTDVRRRPAPKAAPDEQLYRQAVEQAGDPILIHDLEGRLYDVNPATCESLGYTREELLAMNVSDVERSMALETLRPLWETLRAGQPVTLEGVQQRKDGSRFPVELRFGVIEREEKKLIIAIARNLAPRKRAEAEQVRRTIEAEKSRELSRLKEYFLSTLSHEMKTPLSLITGYTELLQDQYPQEALLEGIQEGSRRLTEHINHLLDYTALQSGSLPLYMTTLDVGELVERVQAAFEPAARAHSLRLEADVAPGLPLLQGDAHRLHQMLGELLDNARKVTPPGATIRLRAERDGDGVRIDVVDCGPGIPEPELARIWEAFHQLEAHDALRRGGLGLGLTLVAHLAALHGGRVQGRSQPGQGSCFSLYLPVGGASIRPTR